ncbi:MAG: hypothetical protein ACTS2F_29915 [Thainema sp.]
MRGRAAPPHNRLVPPGNVISERGGIIVSYDENAEPISIEFLNVSQRQLFAPSETSLKIFQ